MSKTGVTVGQSTGHKHALLSSFILNRPLTTKAQDKDRIKAKVKAGRFFLFIFHFFCIFAESNAALVNIIIRYYNGKY